MWIPVGDAWQILARYINALSVCATSTMQLNAQRALLRPEEETKEAAKDPARSKARKAKARKAKAGGNMVEKRRR